MGKDECLARGKFLPWCVNLKVGAIVNSLRKELGFGEWNSKMV
jgi:hypothetical protein